MTGWENENPEVFLKVLGYTSNARNWCRLKIMTMATNSEASSMIEIGCGGLNERAALSSFLERTPEFDYTGTDATTQFVHRGKKLYSMNDWHTLDISTDRFVDRYDILYSQHVMEHLPGLNPALENMLAMTRKVLLNIFFMPPVWGQTELINWSQYPRYHNTYSCSHIQRVCEANGFDCEFKEFNNAEFMDTPRRDTDPPIPLKETVLIATRRKQ